MTYEQASTIARVVQSVCQARADRIFGEVDLLYFCPIFKVEHVPTNGKGWYTVTNHIGDGAYSVSFYHGDHFCCSCDDVVHSHKLIERVS